MLQTMYVLNNVCCSHTLVEKKRPPSHSSLWTAAAVVPDSLPDIINMFQTHTLADTHKCNYLMVYFEQNTPLWVCLFFLSSSPATSVKAAVATVMFLITITNTIHITYWQKAQLLSPLSALKFSQLSKHSRLYSTEKPRSCFRDISDVFQQVPTSHGWDHCIKPYYTFACPQASAFQHCWNSSNQTDFDKVMDIEKHCANAMAGGKGFSSVENFRWKHPRR